MALSMKDVIDNIAEVLSGADGEYVAQIYNQICSDKVTYLGDSLFEHFPDVTDELKEWATEEGWSVMEADGMWRWAGPHDAVSDGSFESEDESWSDMVEANGLKADFDLMNP